MTSHRNLDKLVEDARTAGVGVDETNPKRVVLTGAGGLRDADVIHINRDADGNLAEALKVNAYGATVGTVNDKQAREHLGMGDDDEPAA